MGEKVFYRFGADEFQRALEQKDKQIKELEKRITRYQNKIEQDSDIKRKLMLQIRELGGEITIYNKQGIVIWPQKIEV